MMDSSMQEPFQLYDFDFKKHLEDYFSGHGKEGLFIDLSVGSLVDHLSTANKYFKDIIVLKARERDFKDMKILVDTGKLHVEKEGNCDHGKPTIQSLLKIDPEKENMTEPKTLPPADVVFTAGLLDVISKDEKNFLKLVRKIRKSLKLGGHLLLFGTINVTHMKVGEEKLNVFNYNEDFVRKALTKEKFIIEDQMKTVETPHVKSVIFLTAHKQK
ncbi:phenylethanolamine N-methyltransferase-like [Engystomops pustulosus]|uniref:phenylethanolamine N-methyltransferase-like n=1 Tax=Engystomops pustulosus TaxID=76066 RepID=UPI003AFA406F